MAVGVRGKVRERTGREYYGQGIGNCGRWPPPLSPSGGGGNGSVGWFSFEK